MLKNKVKELLKNKKVLSVCAFVVVAVGLAGAIVALSSSSTSVPEVSKADEVSNKQDNSKDNKKEENKKADNKKEDSKKEDTKKEENKKEENNNSPVEDKEVDTHANEEGGAQTLAVANTGNTQDTNLDSSSGSTSNTDSSSSVSSSSSSNTSNTNTGSSSSSNTSNASSTVAPSEPSDDHTHDHVHNWVPITQQITHPEEGYWADELVSDAWTEETPVYEKRARDICNGCGLDITGFHLQHAEEQLLAGNIACGAYHTEYRQVQVGTNTVYHDAIYSKKWIVSSPAWVETVTTGYQCSDCGATK